MKSTAIFKTVGFWSSLLLFLIPTTMTVVKLDQKGATLPIKGGVLLAWTGLFVVSQLVQAVRLSKEEARRQIDVRLRCVDTLKALNPDQNLRANIFFWDKKKKCYYIGQHHGMEADPAKSLTEIPKGKGCTGAAWEGQEQIWGDEADIFGEGSYALPKAQEEKVNRDLKWICSTPVTDGKRKVIAVLNFDGNKPMRETERDFVKKHAARIAGELSEIISSAPPS